MNHHDLVLRVAHWARNTKKLGAVLTEIGTDGGEFPDVIAWSTYGESWLIECKISRADFHRDKKKQFRRFPERGLGTYRVFATPPGLITVKELPPRWGLIEVRARTVKVRRRPERHELPPFLHMREKRLLVSAIRRATEGWGRQVFGGLTPRDPMPPSAEAGDEFVSAIDGKDHED